jgi:hypothetical protein
MLTQPLSLLAVQVLRWMVQLQSPNGPGITPEWAASYVETAQEIADAAEDNPLVSRTHDSILNTASLITYWTFKESHFHRNPCGPKWDCDHGTSVGLMQVSRVWLSRGYDDSIASALRLMHVSFEVCSKQPLEFRASWYARGKTGCEEGHGLSQSRMRAAKELTRSAAR